MIQLYSEVSTGHSYAPPIFIRCVHRISLVLPNPPGIFITMPFVLKRCLSNWYGPPFDQTIAA